MAIRRHIESERKSGSKVDCSGVLPRMDLRSVKWSLGHAAACIGHALICKKCNAMQNKRLSYAKGSLSCGQNDAGARRDREFREYTEFCL